MRRVAVLASLAALAACAARAVTGCGGPTYVGPDAGAGDASAKDAASAVDGEAGAVDTRLVGAACAPSPELSPTFPGFSAREVTVDPGNAACGALPCLVNHFQGRTSCPYGAGTGAPSGATCAVPGTTTPVVPNDPATGDAVAPQCSDRTAAETVYCSCRCANAEGRVDDGAAYCACPSGFACTTGVVPALAAGDPNAGAYCIREGSAYDQRTACASTCDPTASPCASPAPAAIGSDGGATTYRLVVVQTSGACFPAPLPPRAGGGAACDVLVALAPGDACAAHPGLADAAPEVAGTIRATQSAGATTPVCVLAQLGAPCDSSAAAGWCEQPAAAPANGCAEELRFSASGAASVASATTLLACP